MVRQQQVLRSMARVAWSAGGIIAALTACAHPQPREQASPAQPLQDAQRASPWTLWSGSAADLQKTRTQPGVSRRGMVATDSAYASQAGQKILDRGGNAVDAAVAAAFVLAVSRPHYGSIGGGGFMMICPPPTGRGTTERASNCVALDYREKAPAAVDLNFYVRGGKVRTDLAQDGALASGVPGVVAGLLYALEKFGTQSRAVILARAIELAEKGVIYSAYTESALGQRRDALNAEALRLFGCSRCRAGDLLKQPDLARVLRAVAQKGRAGFYEGWVARALVAGLQASGGVLSEADLKAYRPRELEPIRTHAFGAEIVTMPPPSAGGIVLAQILGFAQRATSATREGLGAAQSSETIHTLAHAMQLAFADRAESIGDPAFINVPTEKLLAPEYLDARWKSLSAAEVVRVTPGFAPERPDTEHLETTHLAVIDAQGWAVSLTTTINDNFGSGFVPPGTGVVMNNEMDDFSLRPGTPNLFGLVGSFANSVQPGKTPLSSMTPVVVRDFRGRNRIAIGASGGPRITTSVFLTLLARLHFGMSLSDAVAAPRFHQQWKPPVLKLEAHGFAPDVQRGLHKKGWTLESVPALGKIKAVEAFWDHRTSGLSGVGADDTEVDSEPRFWSAVDPRGEGVGSGAGD